MLRLSLLNLAWDGVANSTGYDILLDGQKVASAGSRARTTRIAVNAGADHRVEIKAQPSGEVQAAHFGWAP